MLTACHTGRATRRWYDPKTSRWITEDPTGFGGADPNLYRYVANAPTDFIDSTGLLAAAGGGGFLANQPTETLNAPMFVIGQGIDGSSTGSFLAGYGASAPPRSQWDNKLRRVVEDAERASADLVRNGDPEASDLRDGADYVDGLMDGGSGNLTRHMRDWEGLEGPDYNGTPYKKGHGYGNAAGGAGEQLPGPIGPAIRVIRGIGQALDGAEQIQNGDIAGGAANLIGGGMKAASGLGQADSDGQVQGGGPQTEIDPNCEDLSHCIAAGTPILTAQGELFIEEIRPGDLLLSSPETSDGGGVVARRVIKVSQGFARLWHIHFGNQVLRITSNHRVYVCGKGWTQAGALQVGDYLRRADGYWQGVKDLCDGGVEETVYNLIVEDCHTYFAGGRAWGFAVWVHNGGVEGDCGANSAELRRNMEDDGIQFQPGDEAAHIVPSGMAEADEARRIIAGEGVGVNDAANGVPLPAHEHRGPGSELHTIEGIDEITDRVRQGIGKGQANMEAILRSIAMDILGGNFLP